MNWKSSRPVSAIIAVDIDYQCWETGWLFLSVLRTPDFQTRTYLLTNKTWAVLKNKTNPQTRVVKCWIVQQKCPLLKYSEWHWCIPTWFSECWSLTGLNHRRSEGFLKLHCYILKGRICHSWLWQCWCESQDHSGESLGHHCNQIMFVWSQNHLQLLKLATIMSIYSSLTFFSLSLLVVTNVLRRHLMSTLISPWNASKCFPFLKNLNIH